MTAADDTRRGVAADLVAGVSMAGLLLPEAVAYSGIAGLPPQAGVLALFAGLLVYGFIGRSRFAIVSATSSSAAVLGAATLSLAGHDAALRAALAAGLVLATGLAFLAAGAARLGSICSFISKPVLRGFSFGLALVIILKQLPNLTSTHPDAGTAPAFAWQLLAALPQWNWSAMALGLASLVALKLLARLPKLPGALLVIAAGIGAAQALGLGARGVAVVGRIDLALSAPSLPALSQGQWISLAELSLALVLLVFAESYGAIRTMAFKHGDAVDPNRDLFAFGVSNLLSGLIHGLPVGAGFSATAANEAAGATSRKSAWIAGLVVLALVLACLPWIELTPQPVLAAVVIHAVSHTLSLSAFRPYFAWRRDRFVVVAAAVAVVALGVLNGLLAGIAISLAMTLRGLSEPRISQLGRKGGGHDYLNLAHDGVVAVPGVLILRPEAPLFFANVERMLAEMRHRIAENAPRAFVLSLEETPDLDGTTIEALAAFTAEQGAAGRITVLARLKDPVLELLQRAMAGQASTRLEAGSVDDAVSSLV
ncbi:SulP family inorganic anion transporter [Scleromatobacter humisilvae]|uniref:STAS domain-containing protein n=1 Tax=Scleromatobacter humisilvae TaxID=2897159 RepID=A0A9X1YP81_9BURK|nr:SulP family inorganic anion transporter [Scleromatobacter humisilvae]MCK9689160.1 STAS domain-containing protein [Scleromatobacter humisilvae]